MIQIEFTSSETGSKVELGLIHENEVTFSFMPEFVD